MIMRKLCSLLAITFLLQSCFSYRQVDSNPDNAVVGEKYKIEHKNITSKATIKSITDTSLVVVMTNSKEKQIPRKDITKLRKRKFSIVKTAALPVVVVVGLTTLFVYGMGDYDSEKK